MDIINLMKEKSERYNQVQKQIQEFNNELIMLQGEYRLLREMGFMQGILNENGDPTEIDEIKD